MNIVFLLIPLGLVLMAGAITALFWAVNSGQYDDIEDASQTVFESDIPQAPTDPAEPSS